MKRFPAAEGLELLGVTQLDSVYDVDEYKSSLKKIKPMRSVGL